jgi:hypothetical protein
MHNSGMTIFSTRMHTAKAIRGSVYTHERHNGTNPAQAEAELPLLIIYLTKNNC